MVKIKSNTVISVETKTVTDDFKNETRIDRVFYDNGNVLTKSYINNRLKFISLSKVRTVQFVPTPSIIDLPLQSI